MTRPIWKTRVGSISVALWENEAKIGDKIVPMLKASVERRSRDASGNWKSSASFSRSEVLQAAWCLQRAFAEMVQRSAEEVAEEVAQ